MNALTLGARSCGCESERLNENYCFGGSDSKMQEKIVTKSMGKGEKDLDTLIL